jgi:hypothetical protein
MSQTYTKSINEKAKLRQHLKAWRGRDFTEDELRDFELAKVLNAPCTIVVSHTEKDGNIYANIASVGKMMKGVPEPANVVRQFHFDIDDDSTWDCYKDLPEWMQSKINDSLEFKERGIRLDKEGKRVEVASSNQPDNGSQITPSDFAEIDVDSDDLPF